MLTTINIDKSKYFKLVLSLVQPLVKIRPSEAKVLVAIMGVDYANPNLPKDALLSIKLRRIIRDSLKMSENSFNNTIFMLRKKNLIKGNDLNEDLRKLYPRSKEVDINYKIVING